MEGSPKGIYRSIRLIERWGKMRDSVVCRKTMVVSLRTVDSNKTKGRKIFYINRDRGISNPLTRVRTIESVDFATWNFLQGVY